MKTRTGFVSNSSSSSFVLAVDKDVKEITAKIKVSLDTLCDADIITTEKEWEEYLLEDLGYDSLEKCFEEYGDYYKKKYEDGLKQLRTGKVLRTGYVTNEGGSYGENNLELFIYDNGLEGLNCKEIKIVKEVAV